MENEKGILFSQVFGPYIACCVVSPTCDDAHHTFHVSSLSLSLSLWIFFGLFPSPSPLTYASYQNSSYTEQSGGTNSERRSRQHRFNMPSRRCRCTLSTQRWAILFKR